MPVILSRDYWYFALSVIFSFVGHFLQLPVRGKICFCKSQRGVGKLMMEGISSGLSSIGFGRFKWRRILIWLMLLLLNFVRLVLRFHRAWEEARRGRQSPLQGRARSELILSLVYGCKNVPAAWKKKKSNAGAFLCSLESRWHCWSPEGQIPTPGDSGLSLDLGIRWGRQNEPSRSVAKT